MSQPQQLETIAAVTLLDDLIPLQDGQDSQHSS